MRITRPALPVLCLLTSAWLLGACSKESTQEDVRAAQEQAQESADNEAAEALSSPAPLDLWPYVAPLVAGSYAGECTQAPEMKTAQSAIALAANGKTSAPGIEGDFSKSTTMMLMRRLENDGTYYAAAVFDVRDGASLQLMDHSNEKRSTLTLSDNKHQLVCQHAGPMGKLNTQPLYTAFAKLIDVGTQTLQCRNIDKLMTTRDVEVRVGGGVLTVGGQKTDLAKATNETMNLGDGHFSYNVELPGQASPIGLSLHYDAVGKLTGASALPVDGKEYECDRAD